MKENDFLVRGVPKEELAAEREEVLREGYAAMLREKDAEIEVLEKEVSRLTHICRSYALQYGTAMDQSKAVAEIRAEIIAEYIERAKKRLPVISPSVFEMIAKELESWLRN